MPISIAGPETGVCRRRMTVRYLSLPIIDTPGLAAGVRVWALGAALLLALCCARVMIALYREVVPGPGWAAKLGLLCFFWGGGCIALAGIGYRPGHRRAADRKPI